MTSYPVYYVLASGYTEEELREELQYPLLMKMMNYEDDSDLVRYMCILHPNVYEFISELELDFTIHPYYLKDHMYPGKGFTNNLYIPLPRNSLGKGIASEYKKALQAHLQPFIDSGFFEEKQCRFIIPTHTKGGEDIVGSCFIIFDAEVPVEAIVLTKLLLHNLDWNLPSIGTGKMIKCLWAHDRDMCHEP